MITRSFHLLSLLGVSLAILAGSGAATADQVQGIRGQVSAVETTVLAAPVSGRLIDVTRRVGEDTRQGEVLIRFDCRSLSAEREVSNARLSAARAQQKVNSRLASFDNISDLDVELSRVAVEEAVAELKRVQTHIDDCVITAPFNSEIVARQVNPYQFVSHGEPMLELVNTARLEIEAVIPAAWLGHIHLGSALSFVADATGATVEANIDRIVDRIDPVSQTLKVIATPTDSAVTGIKPGMSGEVFFTIPAIPSDLNGGQVSHLTSANQ